MGCFSGCFGGRKNLRRQNRRESDLVRENKLAVESTKPEYLNDVEEITKASSVVIPITEICDEIEEKCSPSPTRKRVTFDSQVKTYEHIVLQESLEILEEKKEEEEVKLCSVNSEVAPGSYPSNHRYKNCRESDDEVEEDEIDCGDSDLDDDEEYYSDDGFSEDKLHKLTNEVYTEESNESVQGVLNPVENLTQWKSAKSKGRTMQKQSQKENSNLISDQEDKKPRNQELMTVEASLSAWLSSASETGSECNSTAKMETCTPEKNKSSCYSKRGILSHDDRPVLCALTLEEIKQFSATSTPRKSPSKSPDETPIIGTVGGYWGNHIKAIDCGSASSFKGIPNTTSKYREDNKVNWHSTPFEARLEKALNKRDI